MFTANESRYANMPYAASGKSGLMLPKILLGLWQNFGSNDSFDNMRAMLRTAVDAGITMLDLANNYGPVGGSAEENFGSIFKKDLAPYRDELLISSKAGYFMWNGPYGDGGSRKYLMASVDQSLKRTGLEYFDIFYHHRMTPETPLEETMGALASIVASGKALYVGLSNYDGETAKRAAAILDELHCPFVICQNRYSMLDRAIEENGLLDFCEENGKGIIAFSPLAQGLLTSRYLKGIPEGSRIAKAEKTNSGFLRQNMLTPERITQINELNDIAAARGQTLAQLALSWVLDCKAVTSVLIGASSPAQITENAAVAAAAPLTFDEREAIEAAVSKGGRLQR